MFSSNQSNVAAVAANYIEDVFSTYLYTGTGAALTVTNNIDLSTYGGLTWIKGRSGATGHRLTDTARGVTKSLASETTAAEATETTGLTAFGTTGFTIGADADYNTSAATYVSWTFREQPKFFDVVTYTGDGVAGRTIAHNLGSVPGCIIVKRTNSGGTNWRMYHRSLGATYSLQMNTTAAAQLGNTIWNDTEPTSAVFSVGDNGGVNSSGDSFVAYIFAHDAGGFGLAGTDNVISCGSYTGSGALQTITLGYEPQWILVKRTDSATGGSWGMFDTMRQMSVADASGNANLLVANATDAEGLIVGFSPIATGFQTPAGNNFNFSGGTYIYIACRRGPMKVPTLGTSVFSPNATTAVENVKITTGFPVDLQMQGYRAGISVNQGTVDRLRGVGTLSPTNANPASPRLKTSSTDAEATATVTNGWDNTGFQISSGWDGNNMIYWNFGRAPGFFDEVCGTGTGANVNMAHNLGAIPEFLIVRKRSGVSNWQAAWWGGGGVNAARTLALNVTNASIQSSTWSDTATATTFATRGTAWFELFDQLGTTYVAYLFATCAGVSKVGSYTGNGTTQTIDCGFTGGARFVLIKRTDSTGDWYVWDSARGIIAGNDPYLLLNSTAAEVTSTDYIDTYSAGFEISSTAPAAINASAGTFVFLAVA